MAAVVPPTLKIENDEGHGLIVRNCFNFDPVSLANAKERKKG
jgi:hypothetical protein